MEGQSCGVEMGTSRDGRERMVVGENWELWKGQEGEERSDLWKGNGREGQ